VRDSVGCLGHGIDWGKGDFVGRAAQRHCFTIIKTNSPGKSKFR
jgi:hypothetical protein